MRSRVTSGSFLVSREATVIDDLPTLPTYGRDLGHVATRPAPRYDEHRRCPDCGQELSVYNPGPCCFRHTAPKHVRIRGRKL